MFAGVVDRLREELIRMVDDETSSYHFLKPEVANHLRLFNYRNPPNIVTWSGGS